MEDPFERQSIRTGVFYQFPDLAMDWLEVAFGFSKLMDVRDTSGHLVHAEMGFRNCRFVVDGEWKDVVASPATLGGNTTQIIYVQIENGLDNHCENARNHGAEIIAEPNEAYYGDRIYRAKDTEGHIWTFSEPVKHVGRKTAEQLGNVKITGWHSE